MKKYFKTFKRNKFIKQMPSILKYDIKEKCFWYLPMKVFHNSFLFNYIREIIILKELKRALEMEKGLNCIWRCCMSYNLKSINDDDFSYKITLKIHVTNYLQSNSQNILKESYPNTSLGEKKRVISITWLIDKFRTWSWLLIEIIIYSNFIDINKL